MQYAEPRRGSRSRSQRKLMGWGILAAVALVIIIIFLVTRQFAQQTSTVSTAVAPAQATTATPAQPAAAATTSTASDGTTPQVVDLAAMGQPERRAFVMRLISQGVFTGVKSSESPPKVGATPLFNALSLDLKRQFIAAVEAYVHNGAPTTEPLEIIDATDGKTVIGTYTVADGLKLQN